MISPIRFAGFIVAGMPMLSIFFPMAVRAESQPVYARNGMVASVDDQATRVGLEILKAGGNAFDAAAAVGFALAVVSPQAGNLGGGGFCVALKADGSTFALDMRERAPAAAHRDMYLDEEGNVVPGLSLNSHLAVGVPGTVDGLLKLQADHGVLKRKDVLAPAIKLAEEGFEVPLILERDLERRATQLMRFPETAALFYPEGRALGFGERLRRPELAKTLKRIRRKGRDGFYKGPTADALVKSMRKYKGIITKKDLAAYEAKYRDPLTFDWNGYTLITHPMPSSGGVTLAQILGMLDPQRLRHVSHNGADYVAMVTEVERLAYADRNHFLGDGDFVDVPMEELMSPAYLAERRRALPAQGRAGVSRDVAHGDVKPGGIESEETSHYCIADADGNIIAVTTTLNAKFGMGAIVEGAGFLLNNEMDDFSAKPGVPNLYGLVGTEANAIEPGKRMLSSMTPTIVTRNGRFRMTMGSPGGSTIITTVLQIFLNVAVWEMNIRDAIDSPRFHHQWLPDTVVYETRALSAETLRELERRGYSMTERDSIGVAAGIEVTDRGYYAGYADRRGPATATGY